MQATDSTPRPTRKEREQLRKQVEKAMANDPVDRLLHDYRALTPDDVLRFDVHWYKGWRASDPGSLRGFVEPLFRTDRTRIRPLRMLRGFLYRLERGIAFPDEKRDPEHYVYVSRPGRGVVYNLSTPSTVGDPKSVDNLPWRPETLRKRDPTPTTVSYDRLYWTWGWSGCNEFWEGPSGPYLWQRPDGRFITADQDAWGDPALIDLVWRPEEPPPDTAGSAGP